MWRSLNEIDDAALTRIMLARNKVRERVWPLVEARHGRIPPSRTCYGDLGEVIVIRIDATLCDCAQRQGVRGRQLQGRLRVSSADRVVRQHRRAAGDHRAPGQRWLEHRRRSHRDHRRRDRRHPGEVAPQPVDHHRRRRLEPRRGRTPDDAEHPAGLVGGLLGRVRPGRAGARRDRADARRTGGRRRWTRPARPARTRRWPS